MVHHYSDDSRNQFSQPRPDYRPRDDRDGRMYDDRSRSRSPSGMVPSPHGNDFGALRTSQDGLSKLRILTDYQWHQGIKALRAHRSNYPQTGDMITPETAIPSTEAGIAMNIVIGHHGHLRDEAGNRTETVIAKGISHRDIIAVEAAVLAEAGIILDKRAEKS
ncbi:rna-binding protein [Penicillium sp. IBT 18751x]|nr:rna-binding protein [Penicillium sp. IBT 18751x]